MPTLVETIGLMVELEGRWPWQAARTEPAMPQAASAPGNAAQGSPTGSGPQ